MQQPTIVITGGAGYIGSHTGFLLAQKGYKIIIIDKLIHNQPAEFEWATLIKSDFADTDILHTVFTDNQVHAVIHFAAYMEVGASIQDPKNYYDNNVVKTLKLLDTMLEHGIKTCIFSSSAATYGTPNEVPIPESHATVPINPYGNTKLTVEKILQDYRVAYGLRYVALRYFNAAGALPEHGLGEIHTPETHVIPLLLRAARAGKPFYIFGSDYPTRDGSCIRDYLHVVDIAQAHILAMHHLAKGLPADSFNLGTGTGTSVKEMIAAVQRVTHLKVNAIGADRRAGDPAVLVADPSKAIDLLSWQPHYSSIDFIIKSAWMFEQMHQRPDSVDRHRQLY